MSNKNLSNEAEKILEKFARKNMIEWNQESFKRTHSRLHRSIIEAINQALILPNVARQSECSHRKGKECIKPSSCSAFGCNKPI